MSDRSSPRPSDAAFPPDEGSPWTTLERRPVYANAWMRVDEHQVIRPDGERGIYGIVTPTSIALGIVPLTPDDHVWLVGQYRYPLGRYSWEIPEGGGDPALDPRAEAERELAEETGLVAGRWRPLLELHTSNCLMSERALVFVAEELRPGPARPEVTERLQTACVPLATALAAIGEGRITDAISVAALLAVARERERRE